MKWIIPLLLLLAACQRHEKDTTAALAIRSESLIAANGDQVEWGDIPGAVDRLSPEDKKRLYRFYPSTLNKIENSEPLSMQDIKNLTRAGVSDDVIIYEMGATGSLFYLTPDDETELAQAGVSYRVINAMKNTGGISY